MFSKTIELFIQKFEELFGLSLKVFLLTATVVIVLGVYIANLVYGGSSIHRLENLQRKKEIIKQEIAHLKQENARLHKQYLEWSDAEK
jgi:cell division protein FtsB